ncbi:MULTISPECIES: hypothetical protein [Kribbella]|uniref:WYL domain-containing protein n=1 Tax=Kribbella karoonensis TaxID=324851 RepID=A0ABN2DD70_9ACTN
MTRPGDDAPLSEEQIHEYVERCATENRWAFEGWLRGERHLDGDPIEPDLNPTEIRAECLWRVRLWLGDLLVEEHVAPAPSAERYADLTRRRIEGLPRRRLTCEPVHP